MNGSDRLGLYLKKVGVGPRGSKDLTRDEAREAMEICLRREASDIRVGAFLLAARLKRETAAEYLGFLDALRAEAHVTTAAIPRVVDLGDPYNGVRRHLPLTLFVAATLGACGLPAVVHGLPRLGPKYGVTHEQMARVMGLDVDVSVADAALALERAGWVYLSARVSQPKLAALSEVRNELVKRVSLSTLEKLVLPIRGTEHTHGVSGYVHKGYGQLLHQLYRAAGASGALVLRSPEGAVQLPRSRGLKGWHWAPSAAHAESISLSPPELLSAHPLPSPEGMSVEDQADLGVAALSGDCPAVAEAIAWTAAAVLWSASGAETLEVAWRQTREAVVGGAALASLRALT